MCVEEALKKYVKENHEEPTIINEYLIGKIKIKSNNGWHGRPSTAISAITNNYKDNVYITKSDFDIQNAKSVMQMLILAAAQNETVYLAYKLKTQNESTAKQNLEGVILMDFEFSKIY